jgi:rRNA maturation endonuclease Nob1
MRDRFHVDDVHRPSSSKKSCMNCNFKSVIEYKEKDVCKKCGRVTYKTIKNDLGTNRN